MHTKNAMMTATNIIVIFSSSLLTADCTRLSALRKVRRNLEERRISMMISVLSTTSAIRGRMVNRQTDGARLTSIQSVSRKTLDMKIHRQFEVAKKKSNVEQQCRATDTRECILFCKSTRSKHVKIS